MHITKIIIDGFKSYANRTVIEGWDSNFNAITGLNGSGKSNILDAICFVFGIAKLESVRAQDMKDLVYKQGTSRVNKATVTIHFDNRKKDDSPQGYSNCDEIIISRQIVIGGKNKYTINGSNANQAKVQNLFQSVSLNVNNPHFLIMQGRITKVCNMRPPELLSLIEEATGTRMYESKRANTLLTLEKKQSKVDEINEMFDTKIHERMTKLNDKKELYTKWTHLKTKIERIRKYVTAIRYFTHGQNIAKFESQAEELKSNIQETINKQNRTKTELEQTIFLYEAEEKSKSSGDASITAANDHLTEKLKEKDKIEATISNAKSEVTQCDQEIKKKKQNLSKLEGGEQSLLVEIEQRKLEYNATKEEFNDAKDRMESLQLSLVGMNADGTSGGNLQTQIVNLDNQINQVKNIIQQKNLTKTNLVSGIKNDEQRMVREQASATQMEQDIAMSTKKRDQESEKLDEDTSRWCNSNNVHITRDGPVKSAIQAKHRILQASQSSDNQLRQMQQELLNQQQGVLSRLRLDFDEWPGFVPNCVKGPFAKLIDVKHNSDSYALEIIAGGRLWNIVVDTKDTATNLLQKGNPRSRITIIPLDNINANDIPRSKYEEARRMHGEKVRFPLDLVEYDRQYHNAARFVLGNSLVCENMKVANDIAFNRNIRVRTVTLDGEVVDPQGTLTGGSKPENSGFLSSIKALKDLEQKIDDFQQNMGSNRDVLALLDQFEQRWHSLEQLNRHIEGLTARWNNTMYNRLKTELEVKQKDLVTIESSLVEETDKLSKLQTKYSDLQKMVLDLEKGDASAQKKLETELKSLKKNIDKLEHKCNVKKDEVERLEVEMNDKKSTLVSINSDIERLEAEREEKIVKVDEIVSGLPVVDDEIADAKAHLDLVRRESEQLNHKLKALETERQSLENYLLQSKHFLISSQKESAKLDQSIKQLTKSQQELEKAHTWITSEKTRFNVPGSDYHFEKKGSLEATEKELRDLENEESELNRHVDKKVATTIENAEREYQDLKEKKQQLLKDKNSIEEVIIQLDKKKKETLETAWSRVNQTFNSIFSTLLSGANCRLKKHIDTESNITGLEMLVSFGGVEKDSLSELSGGQRSLLALSLILALLRFKPAPVYILDEVDAALDLSHTQNIGAMLTAHFPESQFIIVSLKEGMFNHANVLFKTKFIEGTSTVSCTRNK